MRKSLLIGLGLPALFAGACGDGGATVDPVGGVGGVAGQGASSGSGGSGNDGGSAGSGASAGMGGIGGLPDGGGVGDMCDDDDPCRPGLKCNDGGTCEPGKSTGPGMPCVIAGECEDGLQCLGGVCAPAGSGMQGDDCQSDADCETGLRCGLNGLSAECVPEGTEDVGNNCVTAGDCYGGLTCVKNMCVPAPPGVPPFGAFWEGAECEEPSTGFVRAYFEVPGAMPAGEDGDFFRLPFPNDIRVSGGTIDLSGFPTPGAGLLGFDPVQKYVDAIEATDNGWGASPTVFFRFSGEVDFESFRQPMDGSKRPVQIVDITPGDPAFGQGSGFQWFSSVGRSKYICQNWFGVRRSNARPLEPGHTYAYFMTTDGKDKNGNNIQRAEHLVAMLDGAAPSDSTLAAAHTKYAPFRDYLTAEGIAPTSILNAAVITAGEVRKPMTDLAAAVESEPVPTASNWVKCGGGATSPCPQADGDRACGSGTSEYDEYQALVDLPVFQKGTAPYLTDGGDIDASGAVRTEKVCMALSVPKGTMPAGGWPLAVFAHGTGGSFRSHLRPEVAGALSNVSIPGGGTVQFAVLGIDQVQHGPRRGSSTEDPDKLFFNFANPDAARGNALQGGADQISLARFAAALDIDGATSGGDPIKVDGTKLAFFGHSQGSSHGSIGVPFVDGYKGVVLSGNGASLMHSLLNKTEPVNIKQALPFVLNDFNSKGELPGGQMHPVLGLIQQWIDPADPLNFADPIARQPLAGHLPHNVFATYGLNDSYSPNLTMEIYIRAARMFLAASHSSANPADDIGLTEEAVPLSANLTVNTVQYTNAARQYGPVTGSDGHFVVFDVADATSDVARFLGMAANGDVPQVGQ